MTVPQIFFGAQWIGGSTELQALAENGTLEAVYHRSPRLDPSGPTAQCLKMPDKSTARIIEKPPALIEAAMIVGGVKQTYAQVYMTLTGDHLYQNKNRRRRRDGSKIDTKEESGESSERSVSGSSEESTGSNSSSGSGGSGGSGVICAFVLPHADGSQ